MDLMQTGYGFYILECSLDILLGSVWHIGRGGEGAEGSDEREWDWVGISDTSGQFSLIIDCIIIIGIIQNRENDKQIENILKENMLLRRQNKSVISLK